MSIYNKIANPTIATTATLMISTLLEEAAPLYGFTTVDVVVGLELFPYQ